MSAPERPSTPPPVWRWLLLEPPPFYLPIWVLLVLVALLWVIWR